MPDLTDDQLAAIRTEIFAGRKISAIKRYRDATGMGLKESKDVIEALEAELREREPESFSSARKAGCAMTAILFFGLPVAAALAIMSL